MEPIICTIEPYLLINNKNVEANNECGICGENHVTMDCSLVKINSHIPDKTIPSKARLSLPDFLDVRALVDDSFDVYTKEVIPQGTQFGPFQAKYIVNLKPNIRFPLKVFMQDEEELSEYYLDTSEEFECSWLYFVSPASALDEQNLICYQDNSDIYYGTTKEIKPGECLKVWYAPFYAQKMNNTLLKPELPINENNNDVDINLLVKSQQKNMERDTWTCKFCGKLETNITEFAKHLLVHYKMKLKKECEICKSSFGSLGKLKKHLKIVHSSQLVQNPSSKEPNLTITKINPINKDISVGGPLLNDILGDSLDNSNLTLQQTDLNSLELNYIESNILLDNENFNMDNLLNENVKELDHFNFELKDSVEDIVCDICLKVFTKLSNLIKHMVQHTGTFFCHTCKKIFCRQENLDAHPCLGVYKFSCPICKKIFIQKKYLNRHLAYVHSKISCQNCSIIFPSKADLKSHVCKNDGIKQKFPCSKCTKVFYNEKSLRDHIRRHLKVLKKSEPTVSYICEVCTKTFTMLRSFNVHMKTHGDPEFKCETCDKMFWRKDILKNHMRLHTGVLEFVCDMCDKKFKTKTLLYCHQTRVHKVARFGCDECNATFKQKSLLSKHCEEKHNKLKELTTTLDYIYECPLCNIKMKLKSSLNRHIRRKHSDQENYYMYLNLRPKRLTRKKAKPDVQTDTDLKVLDLKETIDNMNFTTDVSLEGNIENNINMEFEDMLKRTTENMDFLNESQEGMVNNLLNIPMEETVLKENQRKEVCLSMPDLSGSDELLKLGNSTLILDGTIVEPQDDDENVVYYILGEKL
ncbi:PR domain zinc finger protein 15 [Aethina tumida]|uniref:PR domain zinc finger protein 15 n=1 Tax=Aethina tumida TaxID=116153 RepID=UPI002148C42D|nr:PR domain zinc finger protein 15 [Aethina tumida]